MDARYPQFVLDGPLGRALALAAPAESQAAAGDSAWIEAVAWEGEGPLAGNYVRFSRRMNVVIGKNGVGKSLIIESIRAALRGTVIGAEQLRAIHPGLVTSVLVRRADGERFVFEHAPPSAPRIRDATGEIVSDVPDDVVRATALGGSASWTLDPHRGLVTQGGGETLPEEDRKREELGRQLGRNHLLIDRARQRLELADRELKHARAMREQLKDLEPSIEEGRKTIAMLKEREQALTQLRNVLLERRASLEPASEPSLSNGPGLKAELEDVAAALQDAERAFLGAKWRLALLLSESLEHVDGKLAQTVASRGSAEEDLQEAKKLIEQMDKTELAAAEAQAHRLKVAEELHQLEHRTV